MAGSAGRSGMGVDEGEVGIARMGDGDEDGDGDDGDGMGWGWQTRSDLMGGVVHSAQALLLCGPGSCSHVNSTDYHCLSGLRRINAGASVGEGVHDAAGV